VPPHFTNYATLSVFAGDGDGTRVACSGHESARSRGASARPATWAPHRTDAVHIDPSVDSSKRGCRNERSLSRLARAKGQPTPGPRVPWREKKNSVPRCRADGCGWRPSAERFPCRRTAWVGAGRCHGPDSESRHFAFSGPARARIVRPTCPRRHEKARENCSTCASVSLVYC
jgi:hypothetical protein